MRLLMAALKSPQHALPPEKLKLLNDAVLDKCDGNDGLKDRLIENPRNCNFDPSVLKCNGTDTASCLIPQQLVYPHLPFGGELGWRLPAGAREPGAMDIDIFRYIATQDPAWDWRSFDLEKDIDRALLHGKEIHAVNPDLAKFKARGGKLLMYHGWSDGGSDGSISALNTISYYESVLQQMGPNQDDWFRLFLVPGMDHCGRGTGPNQFNKIAVLERWREQNEPPKSMTATRVNQSGVIDMTRPPLPVPTTSCL
jgi:feruloyl esterase